MTRDSQEARLARQAAAAEAGRQSDEIRRKAAKAATPDVGEDDTQWQGGSVGGRAKFSPDGWDSSR